MPRFDGTGPNGKGPLTGRGRGSCVECMDSSQKSSDISVLVKKLEQLITLLEQKIK